MALTLLGCRMALEGQLVRLVLQKDTLHHPTGRPPQLAPPVRSYTRSSSASRLGELHLTC
jgi:hypothetical protein